MSKVHFWTEHDLEVALQKVCCWIIIRVGHEGLGVSQRVAICDLSDLGVSAPGARFIIGGFSLHSSSSDLSHASQSPDLGRGLEFLRVSGCSRGNFVSFLAAGGLEEGSSGDMCGSSFVGLVLERVVGGSHEYRGFPSIRFKLVGWVLGRTSPFLFF